MHEFRTERRKILIIFTKQFKSDPNDPPGHRGGFMNKPITFENRTCFFLILRYNISTHSLKVLKYERMCLSWKSNSLKRSPSVCWT